VTASAIRRWDRCGVGLTQQRALPLEIGQVMKPRFGDADDRICLMSGRVGSAHRRRLDERVLVMGDGQEGLDRTTLVHGGVGVGDVVEVGGVVEHEAGVDASGENVVE